MSPRVVWGTAIGALIVFDIHCARNDRDGDTLSEVIRETLRVETPRGRAALIVGWNALGAWLIPHLLDVVTDD